MTQEEHIQQTVEKSITAFWDHEKRQSSSIAEFLYSQFLFIRKRWWILQFGCLLLLWLILNMGFSQVVERKAIAIIIPVFTVLILPELWRTRQCRMEEIENSSVYTTKDIYIARMVLFGIVGLYLNVGQFDILFWKRVLFTYQLELYFYFGMVSSFIQ